ncbi:CHAT domain-containing protein [Desulfocurvibacter africanus]|uniref:CHAT domain-containing protein n=1 Tax=Desulfocurvibacter africanus subsp. africanus str. Walvis Bay TaxID=690850 RepID=F3YVQ1_DESAF|nr:CHAT domain-containing protein [Desulfocurvibacter africanus]EGJ48787.1 hypothetical protein Desaf_0432 [Desulfocurvibacter africanus subsp. africanus str. Walvis Bay]
MNVILAHIVPGARTIFFLMALALISLPIPAMASDPAALLAKGDRQYRLQNLDVAARFWDEALVEAEEARNERLQALARLRLGQVAVTRGKTPEAIAILEPAKAIAGRLGDKALQLNIIRVLFDIYADLEDKEKAVSLSRELLDLAQEKGDQELAFTSSRSLALLYDAMGDVKSASAMRSLYREIHGRNFAAALPPETVRTLQAAGLQGHLDLAQQYADVGNLNKALEALEQGHVAALASGDRTREAFFLHNMFLVYARWGDKPEAARLLRRSLEVRQQHALDEVGRETCVPAIEALLDLKLTEEAIGLGKECLPAFAHKRDDGWHVIVAQRLVYAAKSAGLESDAQALEGIYLALTESAVGDTARDIQTVLDRAGREGNLAQDNRESLEGKLAGLQAMSSPEVMAVLLRFEHAMHDRRYEEAEAVLAELRPKLGNQRLFDFIIRNTASKLYRSAQSNRSNLNLDLALEQYGAVLGLLMAYAPQERDLACMARVSVAQVEAYRGNYLDAERIYLDLLADMASPKAAAASSVHEHQVRTGLGTLYTAIGRFDQAEEELRTALGILSRDAVTEARPAPGQAKLVMLRHMQDQNRVLAMLGDLYQRQGRFAEAEEEYGRARETILDEVNPALRWLYREDLDLATANLGEVRLHMSRGSLEEAQKLLDGLIRKNEERHGPFANRQRLELILLQAKLDLLQGRTQNAHKILAGARAEMERSSGILHPFYAETSLLLAMAAQTGARREAYLLEAADAAIRLRAEAFHVLSEWEKRSYARQAQLYMDALLSALGPDSDPQTREEAYALWTRWKGGLLEEEARMGRLLSQAKGPEAERLTAEFTRVRAELAASVRMRGSQITPEGQKSLLARKAEIERALARSGGDGASGAEPLSVSLPAFLGALPAGSVLVDFARHAAWDLQAGKARGDRYLAFVLDPARTGVQVVDLGSAEDIDGLIARLQATLRANRTRAAGDMADLAAQLAARIVAPLRTFLQGRAEVLLSPDGPLHAMPFELLPTEIGLLADLPLRYLTSAMDLVRAARQGLPAAKAAVFADPDFSAAGEAGRPGDSLRGIGGTVAASVGDTVLNFAPLTETRAEASAVRDQLTGKMAMPTELYLGHRANEENLLSLRSPRLIHIATHSHAQARVQTAEARKAGLLDHLNGQAGFYSETAPATFLLLSGGAGSLRSGHGHGVVTPEKIQSMHLAGTELVVLSSCLSAQGDIVAGQGVFGLTRAFLVAGARSVVSSLWEVESNKTIEFMGLFYARLAETRDPARALQLARSDMRAKEPNPYYWAAFIVTGGVGR